MEPIPMPSQTLRRPKLAAIPDLADFTRKAAEAAGLLKLLANENRLLILCRLVMAREMSVNDLAGAVGLSQSALSQHLAMMREEGLLATRREAQAVFYRIANPNVTRLLVLLKTIYCP
jgi:DNA-binding transcriptional ArsR family regulator